MNTAYQALATFVRQHGAEAHVTEHGVSIGIMWTLNNERGHVAHGVDWSRPLRTYRDVRAELGY